MPVKEILVFGSVILGGLLSTHPFSFGNAIRQIQFSILREVTRTDNLV